MVWVCVFGWWLERVVRVGGFEWFECFLVFWVGGWVSWVGE